MVKKKAESMEDYLLRRFTEKMARLREEKDRVEGEIEKVKGEMLPLMVASDTQIFKVEGVGTVTFVKGGMSLSLKKDKLRGNLLKYMDAADVADVILKSSTVVENNAYIQFSLPR